MNSLYDLMDKLKKIDEAEATAPPRGANMDPAYLQKALNPGGVRMLITPQDAQVALDWLKANPNYKPGQEAPATTGLDPQKAAVQQMAAKSVIKSYLRDKQHLDMVNGYYIEAETGILKHSMIANRTMSAGNQGTTLATSNFMGFGDGKAFADALAEAGLKIEPTTITTKGLFKDNTTPALKVDVALLNKIASGQNGQAPAPVNPAPVNPAPVTTGSDQKADQTATNGPDPKDVAELRDILTKLGITIPD